MSPQKTPPKRPSRKSAAAPKRLEVTVDYPFEGDRLGGGHYAIRLTAAGAAEAQVALDGEPWQACRSAVGHFWFDWFPERPGDHRIEARARIGKGRWTKGAPRSCEVKDS